jgi:hypothetical protein
MNRKSLRVRLVLLMFTLTASALGQGVYSIPAGSGTLTYSVTTYEDTCQYVVLPHNVEQNLYYQNVYEGISYTPASGTAVPLLWRDASIINNLPGDGINGCGPASSYPSVSADLPPVSYYAAETAITFTPTRDFYYGTATVATMNPGIVYPQYKIVSIIYDPPGNASNDGYTDAITDGTTTSIGASFQASDTETFSLNFNFFGLFGDTSSWSYGTAETTGNTADVSDTITQATGVSLQNNSAASNAINHNNDMFVIWLNPAVVLYQTAPGLTSLNYAMGTQIQPSSDPEPGDPEAMATAQVFANQLMANAQGNTSVQIQTLEPQTINVEVNGVELPETLPGLARICANQTYYPNNCSLDPKGQCGCVPSDFKNILAADLLLGFSNSESPLNANTTANPNRFVLIGNALLEGPAEKGGTTPVDSVSLSDAEQVAETYTQSLAYSVGYSWDANWEISGNGPSLTSTSQWTWTNTESIGEVNGTAHTMIGNLSSVTVACDENVTYFEDTLFHTYVFQQPTMAENSSCP